MSIDKNSRAARQRNGQAPRRPSRRPVSRRPISSPGRRPVPKVPVLLQPQAAVWFPAVNEEVREKEQEENTKKEDVWLHGKLPFWLVCF